MELGFGFPQIVRHEHGPLIDSSDQLKGCQFSGWDELLKPEGSLLVDHPHGLWESQVEDLLQKFTGWDRKQDDKSLEPEGPLLMDHPHKLMESQVGDHPLKFTGCDRKREDELLKLQGPPMLVDQPHRLLQKIQMAGHCLKKKSLREHEEEIELLGKFEKSTPPGVFRKEIEDFFGGLDPFLKQDWFYPAHQEAMDFYYDQLYESEGFDLDRYVDGSFMYAPIQPFTEFCDDAYEYELISRLTESAITLYNKQNDTSYKLVDVVKVNCAVLQYFITFTATDGSRTLDFQTRAEGTFYTDESNCDRFGKDYDVLFCRLKPKKMPKESASSHCSDTLTKKRNCSDTICEQ